MPGRAARVGERATYTSGPQEANHEAAAGATAEVSATASEPYAGTPYFHRNEDRTGGIDGVGRFHHGTVGIIAPREHATQRWPCGRRGATRSDREGGGSARRDDRSPHRRRPGAASPAHPPALPAPGERGGSGVGGGGAGSGMHGAHRVSRDACRNHGRDAGAAAPRAARGE